MSISSIPIESLRAALKSQYHAGLAMLKQAIENCPDELWSGAGGGDYINPTWRIAYHTLYYVHLYSSRSAESFTPWEHHQTSIQDMDDIPAPPEILELVEPNCPPQTGEPYTKEQIMTYWQFCDDMIDDAVDTMDLLNPDSGFSWYKLPKLEHQLITIRHLQHHTAQLGSRIKEETNGKIEIDWVGAKKR